MSKNDKPLDDIWGEIPGVADTSFEQAKTATDRMVGLTVQFYGGVKGFLVSRGEKNADGVAMYLTGVFLQSVVGSQNKEKK